MNKTQQILSFVKNGRSKRYTDIVKYICEQNGRAYSRGYYSIRLGEITNSSLKLIQKVDNGRYKLTPLGKLYIVDPVKAQLKARIVRQATYIENLKDRLDNMWDHQDALDKASEEGDTRFMNESEELERLKRQLSLANLNIKELEEEKDDLYTIQVKYIEVRDELSEFKLKANKLISNTIEKLTLFLTLQQPPSGDYSDFSNAHLIKIIKGLIA
tara:strand:- start:2991 stop:3632 length:642 start_codon:yes stop_codon:yes gene_type:complete